MLQSASLRPFAAFARALLLACAALPLACAVATEPDFLDDPVDTGGTPGKAGTGPVIVPSAGTPGVIGGASTGGHSSSIAGGGAAGSPASGGKGGGSSSGGKGGVSSTGGKGGSGGGQAGSSSAGSGGHSGGSGGSAGSTSNGCNALKAWKGGDPNLTIAAGEVIQWMGKRYKATASIAYPNAECAPDSPAMWCEAWFTADGDC